MSGPNFALAVNSEIDSINDTYRGPRYAPVSTGSTSIPFLSYKDTGARMTQWQPSSSSISNMKLQMNLPTDNTAFRSGMEKSAVNIGNNSLKDWVSTTQTLANPSFDTMFCTSNSDCVAYGKNYSCNANYSPFPDSQGNQSGSSCSFTAYPELKETGYFRLGPNEGGIGKSCVTTNDCGKGYECNNETDIVGKNVQQTGYCAQTYICPDGKKRYLGTPWNSGIPIVPPMEQNNNGKGYASEKMCMENATAQQNCVKHENSWYAVFPGYCPVPTLLREGSPQGALRETNSKQNSIGFQIPAYATNASSSMGGNNSKSRAFSAFNRNADDKESGLSGPLAYSLSINPRPSNI
jgi:hypothetical protein